MPRVGKVNHWSLTLSPEDGIDAAPTWLATYLDGDDVTHYVAVAEKASKWHIHVGFITRRKYGSDYFPKKFKKDVAPTDGPWTADHAIEVHFHNDILQLVGGYCDKSEEESKRILGIRGFTDEQLKYGHELYGRSVKRMHIREALGRLVSIPREQFLPAIAFAMAETADTNKTRAVGWLIDAGFAFSQSVGADDTDAVLQRYLHNYQRDRILRTLRQESNDDQGGENDLSHEVDE